MSNTASASRAPGCHLLGCIHDYPHYHAFDGREWSEPIVTKNTPLPVDSEARKNIPMATGLLDYFPAALAYIAQISKAGNDKHNPGEPLHHARGKSMDHADTIMRHMTERGTKDTDGFYHDGKVAWRALAQLQELLEKEEGAPLPRGARLPDFTAGQGGLVASNYISSTSAGKLGATVLGAPVTSL